MQRGTKRAAIVHLMGESLPLEIPTVTHQDTIGENRVARDLDLIPRVTLAAHAFDPHRASEPVVEQVETVGRIEAEHRIRDQPIAAGGPGADAIAVTARLLGPAAGRGAAGIGLGAAVPLDRPAVAAHRAAVAVV